MKQHKKLLLLLGIVLVVIGLYIFTPISNYTTVDSLENLIDAAGPYGPIVFGILYFTITLFFISAAAFSIAAGTLFGNFWGSIVVIVAATASAQVAFYIARYFGDDILHKVGKEGGVIQKLVGKITVGIQANCFKCFFIIRCLFLPYMPVSYAAGLVKEAKPWQFFWATLITNAIFSPAFVYLGDSILKGPRALLLPVLLVATVLLVPKIVKRLQGKHAIIN